MKHIGWIVLAGFTTASTLVAGTGAGTANPTAQKTFDKMLAAILANDRDAFVAEGTEEVKEGVTKDVMENLNKHIGARLKKGYEAKYLCQLKQAGHDIHLWKLTFKDGGDDNVIRLGVKDAKVSAFFIQ